MEQELSPSAFIPFCSFGGSMSVVGKSHHMFNTHVCDKFKPTFLDGKLCYQINVHGLEDKVNKEEMAQKGIEFLLDYNFDRMIKVEEEVESVVKDSSAKEAMIYIESLGKNKALFGEGSYALTEVTEVKGTEAYLGLDEGIRHCQNSETFHECQAKEYLRNGMAKCNCTPYELRDYSKTGSCGF